MQQTKCKYHLAGFDNQFEHHLNIHWLNYEIMHDHHCCMKYTKKYLQNDSTVYTL